MSDYTLIGLMSGSSLDGIDIICARFWFEDITLYWERLGQAVTIPYPERIQSLLKFAHRLDDDALYDLDIELGEFYGTIVKEYLLMNNLSASAIASHGHTVRHNPEQGYSLQIGSGQHIANASGLMSITNFRSEDIRKGGQGAPLAPVVEHYLFKGYKMFLNIGGIANISLHTPNKIIAYDVCPANQLLNHLALQLGMPFDDKGKIASSTAIEKSLVQELHQDPFHKSPYPKSLANSYVRENYIALLDKSNLNMETKLASTVSYIVECIGQEINTLSEQHELSDVLVSGGGAYNEYLLAMLQLEIGKVKINLPTDELIEQKESLLMALCGYLRVKNIPNSFASATGAKEDTINGDVFYPE